MVKMTVGFEIETTNLPLDVWIYATTKTGWKAVTDGSIRTMRTKALEVKDLMYSSGRNGTKFGAELVSPIIPCGENMWGSVARIFSLIHDTCEVCRANNSIHIHVGVPDYRYIIKGWDWLVEIDKILFDISAPKGIARGSFNDFIYYRPLRSPQWAMNREERFRPSIGNIKNVGCKNDFYFVMGRYDLGPPKWYPTRYCGINLVAYLLYGTLEFRHFNFTTNLLTFKTWVYLCIGIVDSLIKQDYIFSVESLILRGAVLCDYQKPSYIGKLVDNISYHNIFDKIDLTPIRTHTGRTIEWSYACEYELSTERRNLIPKDTAKKMRHVSNPHPNNSLVESFSEKTTLYLGELKNV